MFQEFYGFTRSPFSKTIDTDNLFATAGQKELAARLTYLVREQGFGLVTGEIGSGKSTAVRAFTASLDANSYLVIYLANPTTGISGLYRELLLTLGHQPPFTASRMVAAIRTALADLRTNKTPCPAGDRRRGPSADPAHAGGAAPALQRPDGQRLPGHPVPGRPSRSCAPALRLTVNEAFYQRLAMRYHLGPLDLQETIGYVRHHVQVAGYTAGTLFTDDAITRIFEYTKGLPRRINQVCTTALMAGVIDQKSVIDEATVRKAIAELEHE